VVDGIIREGFAQIDPNEVESFSILKDASATAVYGVKGANGVIIITTKRGVTGKPTVSFSAQAAVHRYTRLHTPIDGYRTALLKNTLENNSGRQVAYPVNRLMNWRTGDSPYSEPDVNWMDQTMNPTSTQQQYNLNIRGGTKTARYFISGGYFDQGSPFRGDDITHFKRYNFRSNLDLDITEDFTASLNMEARIEDRQYPTSIYWSSWELYWRSFAQSGIKYPAYNPDGSHSPYNTIALLKESGRSTNNRTVWEIALNLQYKLNWLLKGLAIRGQLAYDDNTEHGKMYNQTPALYEYLPATGSYVVTQVARPIKHNWDDVSNSRKIYWEGAITYDQSFGKHNVNVLLLYNQLLRENTTLQPYATEGIVGRLVYNYAQKYLAEFNLGINGTENFAPGKRYGYFPAFSLGYILSNEDFWQKSGIYEIINQLKIRSSLGWVGNDRPYIGGVEQRFMYLQEYSYIPYSDGGGYMFGENAVDGVRSGLLANPDTRWETARKFDIGIETGFFNNLFSLSIDYFHEYRKDILKESNRIPSLLGAFPKAGNIGVTTNQGVELELSHFNHINKDFSYNLKGTFGFARNKIIEDGSPYGTLPYQRTEGHSIDMPLKLISLGYFQSYEDIENSPSQLGLEGNTFVVPGYLKYKDINGDGIIDRYDMVYTGFPTTPEIDYGLSLGFKWKNFDVSCMFQGVANVSYDKNWDIMWAFSNTDNVFPSHWYSWTPEIGDSRAEYIFLSNRYQNNEAGADYTLSDGSYIRLKNTEVGYTFLEEWTKKGLKNIFECYEKKH
jgi:TonB-linked SusC/RagA family outer membrane protein